MGVDGFWVYFHGAVVLSTDTPSSSAVGKIFKLFSNDLMILL
jgi:hypothetical protein